ncbi:MAG: ferredoxin [Candidatus Nealsonbacteria bacterium]|nr:ferredoxin [Candidatus Nealsonbacteria bacterium]
MKIHLDREKCLGCGSCVAVCDRYFDIASDGRARLKGPSVKKKGKYVEELTISSIECIQNAVDCCPPQAIRLE